MNRLNSASEHYANKRYAAAVQELDEYIRKGNNGALVTRAQMMRSQSYYELALLARQRSNWPLTIRFLKLSNSEEADLVLADVYKLLADQASAAGDAETALIQINSILREIPSSSLVPEMLYRRIALFMDVFVDHEAAWRDYATLFDDHPNNSFEVNARKFMVRIVPNRISYARKLFNTGYFSEGLKILFELAKYPVVEVQDINVMISDAYIAQAENHLAGQDYFEADRFFRIAVQYNPAKRNDIDRRLSDIAELYIKKGDALLAAKDFDNALLHYHKTFDIIPNYPAGVKAIERVNTIRTNIARAAQVFDAAEKLEAGGKYADAQKLYQQAIALDDKPEYRQKSNQMQNLLEAERNPLAFARKIVNEYRGGLLNTRVQNQKKELLTRYKASEIRDSGWKFLLSTGQYKYEARYDLITPQDTFFYVWQINLRDRSITPLNKISENLMR
ncbi:MAG: hypothetical protein U1B83_01510 [Candidatus Cloacimonadaceae bacterium]|nr:hypothetical protein [Candidatus Cloacimonadaceae bacterium]